LSIFYIYCWLREFDVDGYRLDYANGPGADFWPDFRAACKQVKPHSFCFGEIVDSPEALRTCEGRLDGCLDFQVGESLRKTYDWQTWTKSDLDRFLAHHNDYFARDFLIPTFIDNHDMDRFLFIAGGDKDALRRAAARQMSLGGPPIITYGTEIGLTQTVSTRDGAGLHISRTLMEWDDRQDQDLLAYYQTLIRQRKSKRL
jgi:cyclomaltodextrinase